MYSGSVSSRRQLHVSRDCNYMTSLSVSVSLRTSADGVAVYKDTEKKLSLSISSMLFVTLPLTALPESFSLDTFSRSILSCPDKATIKCVCEI